MAYDALTEPDDGVQIATCISYPPRFPIDRDPQIPRRIVNHNHPRDRTVEAAAFHCQERVPSRSLWSCCLFAFLLLSLAPLRCSFLCFGTIFPCRLCAFSSCSHVLLIRLTVDREAEE